MQIIGFNFTKISGEKKEIPKNTNISTSIEFTDISKDEVSILKDSEAMKISFRFTINYGENQEKDSKKDKKSKDKDPFAKIIFEGILLMSFSKQESKDSESFIKKKQLPQNLQLPLYNFLLKKCAAKALELEESLDLPPHIPIPQVHMQPKQDQ